MSIKKFITDFIKKILPEKKETTSSSIDQITPPSTPEASKSPAFPKFKKSELIQTYFNKFSITPKILQPTDNKKVYQKLTRLKKIVDAPKEQNLDTRANEIQETLPDNADGEALSFATVREERWQPTVACPICQSHIINKLDKIKLDKKYQYHYQCMICGHTFYDDTETPFESGVPPIQIWMQCWYLFGTTRSLDYVATKLNLDPKMVQQMLQQLQKLFKVNHPLTRMKKYKDWLKTASRYKQQINDMLQKASELHGLEATGQAKDTGEDRRLKTKRHQPPSKKR